MKAHGKTLPSICPVLSGTIQHLWTSTFTGYITAAMPCNMTELQFQRIPGTRIVHCYSYDCISIMITNSCFLGTHEMTIKIVMVWLGPKLHNMPYADSIEETSLGVTQFQSREEFWVPQLWCSSCSSFCSREWELLAGQSPWGLLSFRIHPLYPVPNTPNCVALQGMRQGIYLFEWAFEDG